MRMFIDGAANPAKDAAAIGILMIQDGKQTQIGKFLGEGYDNHEAEFAALLEALKLLKEKGMQNELVLCHSDSKTVVQAVEKKHSKKEKHRHFLKDILVLLNETPHFHLVWVPEKENKGADQLAKNALRKTKK